MPGVESERDSLHCPGCATLMHSMLVEGNEVRFCEKCHGILLKRQAVLKASGTEDLSRVLGHGERRIRSQERQCPFCANVLAEWQLAGDPTLAVDVCERCEAFYLDRGEYPKITKYLRSQRRRSKDSRPEPHYGTPTYNDPDSSSYMLFQYITDLPLEVGVSQKVLSPGVTAIIILNVLVFAITASGDMDKWINQLALVPSRITAGNAYWTLLSSMFMHADIFHLSGNMYFLFVAGDNVEDSMGTLLFLASYIGFGLVASFAQIGSDYNSTVPCIGASGAISGVIGSYVVLHPTRRFLYRFFYLAWLNVPVHVPAVLYFGLWFIMQFVFLAMGVPGIGWHAHIGGFVAGMALTLVGRLLGVTTPRAETT